MSVNNDDSIVIYLSSDLIKEIRLGTELVYGFQSEPQPPVPEAPIELPNLFVNGTPSPEIPSVKGLTSRQKDVLDSLGIGLPAFLLAGSIDIKCDNGELFLPTRADIVNSFNELLDFPNKLKTELAKLPEKIEDEVEETIRELEEDAEAILQDIENIPADIEAELQGIIDDLEAMIDTVADLFSPYWKKGEIRNYQKEADDCFKELVKEYHIFIPAKILEMISKLVPVSFTVNVLGISIDVLKILEAEEQERVMKQIEDEVDRYYNMIPEQFRFWDGDFGVKCDQWKARLTWQYIKTEIMDWLTNTLWKMFKKLIEVFDEIWEALGLPSIISLLNFDIEGFIKGQVDVAKARIEAQEAIIEEKVKEVEGKIESAKQKVDDFENLDLQKEIDEKVDELVADIDIKSMLHSAFVKELEELELFGYSVADMIGGTIEETVEIAEKKIDDFVDALKDFANNWQKKLLFEWVEIIKKFLDAIGLGKILDLIFLTFCDVLGMLGFPLSIKVV
jgi:hypothetical protein